MIPMSATALGILQGSYRLSCNVESWLGSTLLAADIPIADGDEETDRGIGVPSSVNFTIPRYGRGIDWTPRGDTHPLVANGQRLTVKLGIAGVGNVETIQRGVFLIQDSEPQGKSVSVHAVGLQQLIAEARLVSPYQPTGTLASSLRALLEPALPVLIDAGLVDRAVPASVNYDEDRLQSVQEILDAWPARGYIDPQGFYRVVPATQSTTPVLSLTDGTGGTVIEARGKSTREGAFNAVVARGTSPTGQQVQAVAYATSGPKVYGGLFNPLVVPFFFPSPLLTTVDQCLAAANTVLARKLREVSQEYTVDAVPHPALQDGDCVALTSTKLGISNVPCSIERISLPYKAGSKTPMQLSVRALA